MLNENDVVEVVCTRLAQDGWLIESRCGTTMRGVDVIAARSGQRLFVEAKGATSSKEGTRRYKKGFTSSQAKTHVAVAMHKAMTLLEFRQVDDLVAVALPDDSNHNRHVAPIASALKSMEISIMWVDDLGNFKWHPDVALTNGHPKPVSEAPGSCYVGHMSTTLTPDLEAFVRDEVAAGRYADEAEVIRDAVRRLAELREALEAGKLDALRAALAPGLTDLAAGRFAQGGIMDAAARAAAE